MRNEYYYKYKNLGVNSEERMRRFSEHKQRSRVFFGIAMAVVGLAFLLDTMRILPCISLDASWPVILIVVGAFIGVKHNFTHNAWWILILIGIAYLIPEFKIMGQPSDRFAWPLLIILIGLAIAFRPRRDRMRMKQVMDTAVNATNRLDVDVTFGGRKEIITSKEFNGGNVSATFAGCEINMTQADFSEPSIVIDFRVSFGGVEVIVPSHWDVRNEISPSFGSVEDERTIQTAQPAESRKLLILKGSCSFGSIEIKSY